MKLWKIRPEYKKSIEQTEFYKNDKKHYITYTIGWRSGEYTVVAPENTTIEEWLENYDEDEGVSIYDEFDEVVDSEELDGWWSDYEYENMDEEEFQTLQERMEEEGLSMIDLESEGWMLVETVTMITGPLEIEEIDDKNGSN